jgi:ribonuclease D
MVGTVTEETAVKKPFCISKDEINLLPAGSFPGKISVVSSHEGAERAARFLSGSRMLGFDTETRPSFRRGESHPIALLQLSTDTHAFLIRVGRTGVPFALKRILEDRNIIKLGQGLKHEMVLLHKELGVRGEGFIDLLDIAHRLECSPRSVKAMAAIFLGIRISKSAQTTNWGRSFLTDKQVLYAATDAWACLKIFHEMKRRGLVGNAGNRHR